jgi:hypothetical protein
MNYILKHKTNRYNYMKYNFTLILFAKATAIKKVL